MTKRILLALTVWCALTLNISAANVQVFWDANPSTNAVAHKLFVGTESGKYSPSFYHVAVPTNSATVTNLSPGVRYYFALLVEDRYNRPTPLSDEVSYLVPMPPAPAPGVTQISLDGTLSIGGATYAVRLELTPKQPPGTLPPPIAPGTTQPTQLPPTQ